MLLFLLACAEPIVPQATTIDTGECLPEPWIQGCTYPPFEGLGFLIEDAAREEGIEPAWLAVTVWRESGCNNAALGAAGEIGLTQINPKVWAKKLGASPTGEEMWDPQSNLRYAARILHQLRDSSSSEREMFRKYNGRGPKARKYAAKQMAVLADL